MSRGPVAYAFGLRPAEGGWIICGEWRGVAVLWWRNPRHLLPRPWLHLVGLWRLSQGGMGRGWLPGAGGVNDQPAWLLEAFNILSAEDARIDKMERERAA